MDCDSVRQNCRYAYLFCCDRASIDTSFEETTSALHELTSTIEHLPDQEKPMSTAALNTLGKPLIQNYTKIQSEFTGADPSDILAIFTLSLRWMTPTEDELRSWLNQFETTKACAIARILSEDKQLSRKTRQIASKFFKDQVKALKALEQSPNLKKTN